MGNPLDNNTYKGIQVKTKQDGKYRKVPSSKKIYDILALVELNKYLLLDESLIWLLTKGEAEKYEKIITGTIDSKFLFSEERIAELGYL